MAESEEATDESKRICDIKPMAAVFRITEIVPDKDDHTLNVQIGHLIGKSIKAYLLILEITYLFF